MIIYHITPRSDWEKGLQSGQYTAASLVQEGFIHTSTGEQVAATANRFYRGQPGLVLLVIDTERVTPEVRFEPALVGGVEQKFPHIYGPLNLDAVIEVLDFVPGPDGSFQFSPTA